MTLFSDLVNSENSARQSMHIPPPKMPLPQNNESYNPPEEYLLNENEKKEWEDLDHLDRPFNFIPQKFVFNIKTIHVIIQNYRTRCIIIITTV
jgi:ribosome biogenesis protein ERB1